MGDRDSAAFRQPQRPGRKFFPRCAIAVILLFSQSVVLAQSDRPAPDPILQKLKQAMREGRVADAEKIAADTIQEIERADPDSPRLPDYLGFEVGFLDRKGRFEEAFAVDQRILEIHRKTLGPTDMEISTDLINLAQSPGLQGNDREIERLLKESIGIVRTHLAPRMSGRDVDMAAMAFGSLGSLYLKEERWKEAEPLVLTEEKLCGGFEARLRSGIAMCESLPQRLAELYRAEGKGVDAEQVSPASQSRSPELAALNKAAQQYERDGLYPSAEDSYNQAVELAEKLEANPQNRIGGLMVQEFNLLGELLEKQGLNDRAEAAYASALDTSEKTMDYLSDRVHFDYAAVLNFSRLLNLYRNEGRLKDIEPVIQHVLDLQEKSLGGRHRVVVRTLTKFAGVCQEEGKFAEARLLYERALKIQEANLGPDDSQLVSILTPYADVLRKLQEDAGALEVQDRIDAIQKKAK